jgi:hypothetical protein
VAGFFVCFQIYLYKDGKMVRFLRSSFLSEKNGCQDRELATLSRVKEKSGRGPCGMKGGGGLLAHKRRRRLGK